MWFIQIAFGRTPEEPRPTSICRTPEESDQSAVIAARGASHIVAANTSLLHLTVNNAPPSHHGAQREHSYFSGAPNTALSPCCGQHISPLISCCRRTFFACQTSVNDPMAPRWMMDRRRCQLSKMKKVLLCHHRRIHHCFNTRDKTAAVQPLDHLLPGIPFR